MPLDHFVSQVHLNKFKSPELGNRMFAVRKSDLMAFQPRARDVCRIEGGSTNEYLKNDRAIEEFLQTIEPKYTKSIDKLAAGEIDVEAIYAISGFVAYIISCSPAGMRINSELPKKAVEIASKALDAMGELPDVPEELGGESLTELLETGKVKVDIDPKYPQAIGIANVLDLTRTFGNFYWEVLRNRIDDSPFLTSDFPMAIEPGHDIRVVNRIVPLTPDIALRICPDINTRRDECDFTFSQFRSRVRTASRQEVSYINRTIIRCAETMVFFRDDLPWVYRLIERNRDYRIEPQVDEIPHDNGSMLVATQRIVGTIGMGD